jgi:hypothetical protein
MNNLPTADLNTAEIQNTVSQSELIERILCKAPFGHTNYRMLEVTHTPNQRRPCNEILHENSQKLLWN